MDEVRIQANKHIGAEEMNAGKKEKETRKATYLIERLDLISHIPLPRDVTEGTEQRVVHDQAYTLLRRLLIQNPQSSSTRKK